MGWGAWSKGIQIGQPWSSTHTKLHINELEPLAAFLDLQAFGKLHLNGSVLRNIDSTAAVAAINRMGSSQSPCLNRVANQL